MNEFSPRSAKWIELRLIVLSERLIFQWAISLMDRWMIWNQYSLASGLAVPPKFAELEINISAVFNYKRHY